MSDKTRTSIESVIRTAINSALLEVHTCLPAVVTNFTASTQLIDCQVTIKRKLNGKQVLLPLLKNVPVRYPKSNTFSITYPLEIGDHVLLLFCERSIDTWLTYGGIQDPFDIRKFELSDAFAIPSMYSQPDVIPNFDPDFLQIKTNSGDTKIMVKDTEGIELRTSEDVIVDCDQLTVNCETLFASVNGNATVNCNTANLSASAGVNITSPLTTINGNLTVTGTITGGTVAATSSLTVDGQEMGDHRHSQGADSDGDSEVDVGPPIDGP